jgi:transformation/transcription domain-associated protein
MSRKIATRRKGLEFSVPSIVPISSHARLVREEDPTVTLEEILNRHISANKLDDPVQFYLDRLVEFHRSDVNIKRGVCHYLI